MTNTLSGIDPNSYKKMRNILSLPEAERNKEIAYWAVSSIDELRPKPLPTMPDSIKRIMDQKEDGAKIHPDFFKKSHVVAYYKSVSEVKAENDSNFKWLKRIYNYVPKGDINTRNKIYSYLRKHNPGVTVNA